MELHRRGYSAFVLVYRVNVELHETEPQAKGGEASKDVLPAVRYLIGHQAEYGYDDGRLWYVRVLRWRPDDDSLRIF